MNKRRRYRPTFSFGTGLWRNLFGVPLVLLWFGVWIFVMNLFPVEPHIDNLWPGLLVAAGVAAWLVQHDKWRFRLLTVPNNMDAFKGRARKIMKENGWTILCDDTRMMEAVLFRDGHWFDTVVLKFRDGMVLWSVLPPANDLLTAMFSRRRHGKRLMKQIKECAR